MLDFDTFRSFFSKKKLITIDKKDKNHQDKNRKQNIPWNFQNTFLFLFYFQNLVSRCTETITISRGIVFLHPSILIPRTESSASSSSIPIPGRRVSSVLLPSELPAGHVVRGDKQRKIAGARGGMKREECTKDEEK